MRAVGVVVADVEREDAFEVPAVHDQEPIETLPSNGPDPALDERVRAGRSYRCSERPDALGAELAQAPVGFAVMPARYTRRVASSMNTSA